MTAPITNYAAVAQGLNLDSGSHGEEAWLLVLLRILSDLDTSEANSANPYADALAKIEPYISGLQVGRDLRAILSVAATNKFRG